MSDITGRNMLEKWYPVSSATVGKTTNRSELAHIRVKGRYHSVDILPMDMYHDLIQVGTVIKKKTEYFNMQFNIPIAIRYSIIQIYVISLY